METKVGIYDTHEKAVEAVEKLLNHNIKQNQISMIGKAEITDNHIHLINADNISRDTAFVGIGAGTITGLLSGIGVFTIPGFGFLYGAGAVVGAIAGFDLGLIAGGLMSVLEKAGFKKDKIVKFEEHINEGKFAVIVKGTSEDIEKAEGILNA